MAEWPGFARDFGVSIFGPSSFGPSGLAELGGAGFRERKVQGSLSYAIVKDARGCWEERRNCHERVSCRPNICRQPVIAKKRIVGAKNKPMIMVYQADRFEDAADVIFGVSTSQISGVGRAPNADSEEHSLSRIWLAVP